MIGCIRNKEKKSHPLQLNIKILFILIGYIKTTICIVCFAIQLKNLLWKNKNIEKNKFYKKISNKKYEILFLDLFLYDSLLFLINASLSDLLYFKKILKLFKKLNNCYCCRKFL